MAKKKKKTNKINKSAGPQSKTKGFPLKILQPVANFLTQEVLRLERKKKSIAQEDPFADSARISDNASPDTDMVEQIGHARVKALEGQINRKLIQIKKALTRIKIGKYGLCEKCGKMIDTDRLMIVPESTLCVTCEKKKEK
jgi:RNA polymerase-binding transcription factor DksA